MIGVVIARVLVLGIRVSILCGEKVMWRKGARQIWNTMETDGRKAGKDKA